MEIKKLSCEEFWPIFKKRRSEFFENTLTVSSMQAMTEAEKENFGERREAFGKRIEFHLGLYNDKGELVGWSSSFQSQVNELYMMNSVVAPEYRRQGHYTKMVERTLSFAREQGFQTVSSNHTATNNAVIVPKLKLGFKISGLLLDDAFGTLVKLVYHLNDTRAQAMEFRSGQKSPSANLKKLLGL